MSLCACGNSVRPGSSRCPRCDALNALDLEMDATEAQIRNAYRLLVKVWHPDRFQTDQKLKEAAETKVKEVNSAYDFLTSAASERGPWRPQSRPAPDAASSPFQEPPATARTASNQSPGRQTVPIDVQASILRLRPWPIIRFSLKVAALFFALLLGRYLWIAFEVPDPAGGDVARIYDIGKDSILRGLDGPKRRFFDAVERDWRRIVPRDSRATAPDIPQTGQAAPSVSPQTSPIAPQKPSDQHPHKSPAATPKILPYITVGSTKDEVLTQLGAPTSSSEDTLAYGKSELYLKGGSVIGWRIDPVSSPIRVMLWPSSAVDPNLASYTIGSTKDEVLTVQGTPSAFTGDRFEYGKSEVIFHNNRVVSWKEDPHSTPLWAR